MATPHLSRASWRKSSRSNASGCCVEVAAIAETVSVRDSKAPAGPVITVTARAWRTFTHSLKAGKHDL